MALLDVLSYPDKFLKTVAKPVEKIDDDLKQFAADMIETMYADHGIGLASVQVGDDRRIIVVDVNHDPEDEASYNPIVMINPTILEASGETAIEEGCLSVPEFRAEVKRNAELRISYYDLDNKEIKMEIDGLFAICIQHEIDHLNGKLFIDHLPPLKRKMIQNKLKKMARHEK